jgi:hypothetical protein
MAELPITPVFHSLRRERANTGICEDSLLDRFCCWFAAHRCHSNRTRSLTVLLSRWTASLRLSLGGTMPTS